MPARSPSFSAHSWREMSRRSGRWSRSGRPACRARRRAADRRWSEILPAAIRPALAFHIHLWPMAQTLRGTWRGIGDAAQHRRHHVAMLQRGDECGRASRDCAAASAAAWRSPTRTNTRRRTTRSPRVCRVAPRPVISAASRHGAMVAPQIVVVQRARSPRSTGITLDPVVSSAIAATSAPSMPAPSAPRAWPRPARAMWSAWPAWRDPDRPSFGAAVLRRGRAQPALLAIEDRNPDAQRPEIDSGNNHDDPRRRLNLIARRITRGARPICAPPLNQALMSGCSRSNIGHRRLQVILECRNSVIVGHRRVQSTIRKTGCVSRHSAHLIQRRS